MQEPQRGKMGPHITADFPAQPLPGCGWHQNSILDSPTGGNKDVSERWMERGCCIILERNYENLKKASAMRRGKEQKRNLMCYFWKKAVFYISCNVLCKNWARSRTLFSFHSNLAIQILLANQDVFGVAYFYTYVSCFAGTTSLTSIWLLR